MTHRLDKVINRLMNIDFTETFAGEHEEVFNLLDLARKACVSESQVSVLERIFLGCAAWARKVGMDPLSFKSEVKKCQDCREDDSYNPTLISNKSLNYAIASHVGRVAETLRYRNFDVKICMLHHYLPRLASLVAEKLTRIEEKEKQ